MLLATPFTTVVSSLNGAHATGQFLVADQSCSQIQALQVEVMAMGESSDTDFPAIYDDLFGKRTFDNSEGGWSYEVFNSFRLPDFLG